MSLKKFGTAGCMMSGRFVQHDSAFVMLCFYLDLDMPGGIITSGLSSTHFV
jgi:hypothetical protein